ncbi:hypothetical protein AVEN_102667-1 [Araneus ventricosus]|uniref:Uncharacterized protein n=1 Tax=Araneus ventricosus TaxID=182803 RepID=A0A4Y2VPL2_ARAVE|nr:hypothetical protein AVEN_102667-1 [Araneus ventricosus]
MRLQLTEMRISLLEYPRAAPRVHEIPSIFEQVRQLLHRRCQTCITVGGLNFEFRTVIVNTALVNDAVNKHFVFPFISYFLCLRLTASFAPTDSYTINDCYSVLYQALTFVP